MSAEKLMKTRTMMKLFNAGRSTLAVRLPKRDYVDPFGMKAGDNFIVEIYGDGTLVFRPVSQILKTYDMKE